jgi:hypothetical protein
MALSSLFLSLSLSLLALCQLCEQLRDEDGAADPRTAEVAAFARMHLVAAHAS